MAVVAACCGPDRSRKSRADAGDPLADPGAGACVAVDHRQAKPRLPLKRNCGCQPGESELAPDSSPATGPRPTGQQIGQQANLRGQEKTAPRRPLGTRPARQRASERQGSIGGWSCIGVPRWLCLAVNRTARESTLRISRRIWGHHGQIVHRLQDAGHSSSAKHQCQEAKPHLVRKFGVAALPSIAWNKFIRRPRSRSPKRSASIGAGTSAPPRLAGMRTRLLSDRSKTPPETHVRQESGAGSRQDAAPRDRK